MIRRAPRLFRAAALLAVLGTLLGWMEVAIPDVHDGHTATPPEAGAGFLAHGHPSPPAGEPGHAPQAPHTCHCIHAHAPALPAAPHGAPRPGPHHLRFASLERAPASVTPEPRVRPPVA